MKNRFKHFRSVVVALLLTAAFLPLGAFAQSRSVTVKASSETLKSVLGKIEKSTGYTFMYNSSLVDLQKHVSVNAEGQDISAVLDNLLRKNGIVYEIRGKQIVLSPAAAQQTAAQRPVKSGAVKGTVTDAATQEPLIGAVVYLKNDKTIITVTDADGSYSFKEVPSNGVLVCQMIGMKDLEMTVGTKGIVNFAMEQDVIALNDVVVTGYQTISKERSAGSYAVLTTEKIEKKLQTNIMDRLEGQVSGMQMYKGKPVIRGISTIHANKNPLYIVDGVPFEGDVDMINPNDIVNVSVLKDATAASIYGARSTNGVIVITTRSGKTGKLHVNYSGTVSMEMLPDRKYTNNMSTAEFVDFQQQLFTEGVKSSMNPEEGLPLDDVNRLLFSHRDGNISDAELRAQLDRIKGFDRYQEAKDMIHKVALTHQHNLSFNGGTDFYKYSFSLNYTGSSPYDKNRYSDRLGFNVKNNFNFTKWFKADVALMGNVIDDSYDDGFSIASVLDGGAPSYQMLKDEKGNPMLWEHGKSREEVARLNGLGLQDESYYPLLENRQQTTTRQNQYLNFNLGLRFDIIESLNIELRYQTELGSSYNKHYKTKDAYSVKSMINDATVVKDDGTKIYHIPQGGQVNEQNRRTSSYTMRAQINYHDTFNEKHDLTVLAGAERRRVRADGSGIDRYGYDDFNLSYKSINETELRAGIYGTEAVGNYFQLYDKPTISSMDDRYVSFYANASYTYNRRLSASASIRMDQSNLFGTDPKYQYKPLWSVGANYQIFEQGEVSWINRLSARATYGINGNVYKESGPYIISRVSPWGNWTTNEAAAEIVSPPNAALRWEKTKTFNVGLDFAFLKNRLNGSVEYYLKRTDDMLGMRDADPTLGWNELMVNYAEMRNTGVEITLGSVNIDHPNFKWTTDVMFSYNNNKITNLQNSANTPWAYYKDLQAREGKPYNALYSIRYAGLDKEGNPQGYKADGTIVSDADELALEDLVYSGTYDPPFNASMTNTFSLKGFDLSFMFIYYGGHVLRDAASSMYLRDKEPHYAYTSNMDRMYLDRWQKPGDEADRYILPAYRPRVPSGVRNLWEAGDIHIEKGDFIKLRDISLSYTFPNKLIQKARMQNLRLTFQAQNVWMWAANRNGYDPEAWTSTQLGYADKGSKVPPTFVFGLNINF